MLYEKYLLNITSSGNRTHNLSRLQAHACARAQRLFERKKKTNAQNKIKHDLKKVNFCLYKYEYSFCLGSLKYLTSLEPNENK